MMRAAVTLLFIAAFCASSPAEDPLPLAITAQEMSWPAAPDVTKLKAFQEPSLEWQAKRPHSDEIRFIWMRTFHPPIVVRAFADANGAKLRMVRLDGKGGYEFGTIDLDKTVDLKIEHWRKLEELTKKPKARDPLKGMTVLQKYFLYPLDGSSWTLEVRDPTKYTHEIVPSPLSLISYLERGYEFVDEFVLPDVRDFAAVCQKLLELAKSAEPNLFDDEDLY